MRSAIQVILLSVFTGAFFRQTFGALKLVLICPGPLTAAHTLCQRFFKKWANPGLP